MLCSAQFVTTIQIIRKSGVCGRQPRQQPALRQRARRASRTPRRPPPQPARAKMYAPLEGHSPERRAAQSLRSFFTFVAVRIVMSQLEGIGRGDLGSYNSEQMTALAAFVAANPIKDGDDWVSRLMAENQMLAVRVMEVREGGCNWGRSVTGGGGGSPEGGGVWRQVGRNKRHCGLVRARGWVGEVCVCAQSGAMDLGALWHGRCGARPCPPFAAPTPTPHHHFLISAAYARDNEFEWDQLRKLCIEDTRAANVRLLREHADQVFGAALTAEAEHPVDPGGSSGSGGAAP